MATSNTDEEWDELSPENFETAALLRAVDAVDEFRRFGLRTPTCKTKVARLTKSYPQRPMAGEDS